LEVAVGSLLRSRRFWLAVQGLAGVAALVVAVAGVAIRWDPQPPSSLAVRCLAPGGDQVLVTLEGDGASATITREPDGDIVVGEERCLGTNLRRVDRIRSVGRGGAQSVTIDLAGGPFAPGATVEGDGSDEVEFEVALGAGDDLLSIRGNEGPDALSFGTTGINLDTTEGTGDADVTLDGVETVAVRSSDGDDRITGMGDLGAGEPFALPLEVDGGLGDDEVVGGAVGDRLVGSVESDALDGAGGDDEVIGDEGQDRMGGGEGDDVLDAGTDDDVVVGGPGDDREQGGDGNDTFRQEAADGADRLEGGPGLDRADYRTRVARVRVTLDGSADDGEVGEEDDVGPDVENVTGGKGDDLLAGGTVANRLEGGGGDDVLRGGGADDVLSGGPGTDVADFADASGPVRADLATGRALDDRGGRDRLEDVEDLSGGSASDTLTGDGGPNEVRGLGGADRLAGGGGDDVLEGRGGDDRLAGDDGVDLLRGAQGDDALTGGPGEDEADYREARAGVTVDLAAGDARDDGTGGSDSVAEVEAVAGSPFSDTLRGDGAPNRLAGGGGADVLSGRGGDDELSGGQGRDSADYRAADAGVDVDLAAGRAEDDGDGGLDVLVEIEGIAGGPGNDVLAGDGRGNELIGGGGRDLVAGRGGADALAGGDGVDTVTYEDAPTGVSLSLNRATATDDGTGATDRLVGFERVSGGLFDDALLGDGFSNTLLGGGGDDRIAAGGGVDRLAGGVGADDLDGGDGRDTCTGGEGADDFARCEVTTQ
jgi:Ca2+-binding RTX toxin-like protein